MAQRLCRQLVRVHPPAECCQQGFCLQAGNVLADALVDAHAEADVPGRVAVKVEDALSLTTQR